MAIKTLTIVLVLLTYVTPFISAQKNEQEADSLKLMTGYVKEYVDEYFNQNDVDVFTYYYAYYYKGNKVIRLTHKPLNSNDTGKVQVHKIDSVLSLHPLVVL